MGHALLWLADLASALLLVAVVFAWSGRLEKRQMFWPLLLAVLISLLAIITTVASGFLFFKFNIHPAWLFPYSLSWTVLFIAGTWVLIRRGPPQSVGTPALALLIALAVFGITLDRMNNAFELEGKAVMEKASLKAEQILPAPPEDGQDAKALYEEAERELGEAPDWLWQSTDPAFDPKSDTVQKFLKDKKKALDLFKEAAQKPRLHYPQKLSHYDWIIPWLFGLHTNVADLLALDARAHALSGQTDAALQNISTMERITDQLAQTPFLLNALLAGRLHEKSQKTLEIILAERPARSRIDVTLPVTTHDQLLQAFHKSLIFEETSKIYNLVEMLIKKSSKNLFAPYSMDPDAVFEESFWNALGNRLYPIIFFQTDLDFHEAYWNKVHGFTQQPYHAIREEYKEWDTHSLGETEFGLFTSITHPQLIGYINRVNRHQAQYLLANLGLATAAFHSQHQKYPATLGELAPQYITEIPKDPFDGKPLKMIHVDGGLVLYSIGEDLKDDGGREYDKDNGTEDITFCLGAAYQERRLKPALDKKRKEEEKEKSIK